METVKHEDGGRRSLLGKALVCAIGFAWIAANPPPARAAFDSTSTGADLALAFNCPTAQTIEWDPGALDANGDGIFEFTTITIPQNCTVKLTAARLGQAPVVWLASGDVVIDGTLDLSGGNGHPDSLGGVRSPAIPGPGGFAGGPGTVLGEGTALPGHGPGAGGINGSFGGGAGHAAVGEAKFSPAGVGAGKAYGSGFLIPLLGGSGGGGAPNGGGGGAGGGAIVIASTSSIRVNGSIKADGGAGGRIRTDGPNGACRGGGGGSGGSIRLVTPQMTGIGQLSVKGGGGLFLDDVPCPSLGSSIRSNGGSGGRIRIESTSLGFTGTISAGESHAVPLSPTTVIRNQVTVTVPTLRVISVNGVAVPGNPSGGFSPADVTINTPNPVPVEIVGEHVPVGTRVTLEVHHDTLGIVTYQSDPLIGTEDLSTTTVTATISPGFSLVTLRADWNP